MVGIGSILLGRNTARFVICDTMRAIDYLQSRPEVDPQRIGCTGYSGGGIITAYVVALDDRVQAAAPSLLPQHPARDPENSRSPGCRTPHLGGPVRRPAANRSADDPRTGADAPLRGHQGLLRH